MMLPKAAFFAVIEDFLAAVADAVFGCHDDVWVLAAIHALALAAKLIVARLFRVFYGERRLGLGIQIAPLGDRNRRLGMRGVRHLEALWSVGIEIHGAAGSVDDMNSASTSRFHGEVKPGNHLD